MRGTLVDRCDRCGSLLIRMTPEQHAAVEMVYRDLSAQRDWPRGSGIYHDVKTWHELMVATYAEYKGWKPQILPALEGDGFVMVMRQKQSRLTKRQGSELIEFANAWAANNGVIRKEKTREAQTA